jgi:hypothetical protein
MTIVLIWWWLWQCATKGLRLLFQERFLAALLAVALLKSGIAVAMSDTAFIAAVATTIDVHPAARQNNHRCQPRGYASLAAPWPWQQRCENSSERSRKYVHLNQCNFGSAAENRSWKRSPYSNITAGVLARNDSIHFLSLTVTILKRGPG